MGTVVEVTALGPERAALQRAVDSAYREMQRLTDIMSHYDEKSVVSEIARQAGRRAVAAPPELMAVLRMARAMSERSGGAFDITVGALRGWRFEPGAGRRPEPEELRRALALVDYRSVVLDERAGTVYLRKPGMRLDLGGIAKLPILHAGMKALRAHGVRDAMINAGGDLETMGTNGGRPWRIGLRHPRKPGGLLGMLELADGFVASSGDYERYFERDGRRYHHILDPRTGAPVTGAPRHVTLVGGELAALNGLGVAIMVRGPDWARAELARRPGVEALIVEHDGREWVSPGLAARYRYRPSAP
jgi:thiamine biosynthesis lipoprotein